MDNTIGPIVGVTATACVTITINIQGTPYPDNFSIDIEASLARLTDEYRIIQGHSKSAKTFPLSTQSN
jgi:hypothetical protein